MNTWILTYLLHSTLLAGTAWILLKAVRGPAARVWLLRGALLAPLVTTPMVGVLGTSQTIAWPVDSHMPAPGSVIALQPTEAAIEGLGIHGTTEIPSGITAQAPLPNSPNTASETSSPFPWLSILLGLGLVIGMLRFGVREWKARRALRHRAPMQGPALWSCANEMTSDTRLAGKLQLSDLQGTSMPFALGGREIVCPSDLQMRLDPPSLRALFAHEIAHLVRRDPHWLGLCRMVRSVLWLQPLNAWTLGRLETQTELAADDWAAERLVDPLPMARLLGEMGQWVVQGSAPAGSAAVGSKPSQLVQRIERLLAARPTERRVAQTVGLATGLGVVGLLACAGPKVSNSQEDPPREIAEARGGSKAEPKGSLTRVESPPVNEDSPTLVGTPQPRPSSTEDLAERARMIDTFGANYAPDAFVLPTKTGGMIHILPNGDWVGKRSSGMQTLESAKEHLAKLSSSMPPTMVPSRTGKLSLSSCTLQIRVADKTPYRHLAKALQACATKDVSIYKIELALMSSPDEFIDISLPVDSEVIEEEIEEEAEEEMDEVEAVADGISPQERRDRAMAAARNAEPSPQAKWNSNFSMTTLKGP